jgi:hypothetical protein
MMKTLQRPVEMRHPEEYADTCLAAFLQPPRITSERSNVTHAIVSLG